MTYLATWILCLLYGIIATTAITVSPDLGLRNQSLPDQPGELIEEVAIKPIGKAERIRRLIPYSTFYIPNFAIQDYYRLNPIQQQRLGASLAERGSLGPPPRHDDHQEVQVTRLQHVPQKSINGNAGSQPRPRPQHSFNFKFPSLRPNFQIIAYNTRHQSAPPPQALPLYREPDENSNPNAIHSTLHQQQPETEHKLPPLSFKNSNMNIPYHVYQQDSASKTIFTPFTNKNKIPGAFRPIIYTDTEQVLRPQEVKHEQPSEPQGGQSEEQPKEPTQQEAHQEQHQPEHHSETEQPSSTQRPIYYENITEKPVAEPAENLTPQEKYVAYLQQQIQRQTQRLKQQNQEPTYIESSKTSPLPVDEPNHSESVPSTTQSPFVYPQVSSPSPSNEDIYNPPREQYTQQPSKVVQESQPTRFSAGIKNNYLEYLEQHPEQIISIPNLIPSNQPYNAYNPLVYYSTPNPNYLTSIPPSQRVPGIEPLYEAEPVFNVPVKNPPPPVRQHLTETSKHFSPVLTTYRPHTHQITTPQPIYNSYVAPPRSQKKKQAHNYRPSPAPGTGEDVNTNTVRFPDEVPQTRPIQVDRPEPRPEEVPAAPHEESIQHVPVYRPIQRPNHYFLQRPPQQNFLPDYGYQPEVVEIPRPKLRPKLHPEMVLKLRPQPYLGHEYRPDLRPSSSYLSQADNAPTVIVKQRPYIKPSPYAPIQFQPGRHGPPRPNPDLITHLQLRPGPYNKHRLNVKINPDLLAPSRQEYHHDTFQAPASESGSNSGPISKPDIHSPPNAQEHYHPEVVHLDQSPQQQPQPRPEAKPEPIESETFYTHHSEPSQESPKPNPVYIQEHEVKPESEETVDAEKSDSHPEPSHPVSSPASITSEESSRPIEDDPNENNLAQILRKLQDTNQLPKTLTPDNIDNSIRTLIKILNNLKETQTLDSANPPHQPEEENEYQEIDLPPPVKTKKPGPTTGRAGIDYPILAEIPKTSFSCKEQRYKGFFGDPETGCQVWHYCDLNGGQASFLCPNGTIFSQVALTCDWWFNVKCSTTAQLYVLNERLYKYILPFTPKFPEDYSGPLVDKYLALKFKEMEDKMRRERLKGKKADEQINLNGTISSHNETHHVDSSQSDEELSEEAALGSSSIDTYSTTEQSLTTEITSNSISPKSVSSTHNSYESDVLPPSSTTSYAAVLPSEIPGSTAKSKITVESEKIEVIEIKANGDSGHLSPSHTYVAED